MVFNINSSFNETKYLLIKNIKSTGFFDELSLQKRELILQSSKSLLKIISQSAHFSQKERAELLELNKKWVAHAKGGMIANFILRVFGYEEELKELEPNVQNVDQKIRKTSELIKQSKRKEKIFIEKFEDDDFPLGIAFQKNELLKNFKEYEYLQFYGQKKKYSLQNQSDQYLKDLVNSLFVVRQPIVLQRIVQNR